MLVYCFIFLLSMDYSHMLPIWGDHEMLNQLVGFDSRENVKVILATNRIETLDHALLSPSWIVKKIEFPLPDIKNRRWIFQVLQHHLTN